MNIHISKHTRIQPWDGRKVFGEYPLYLRPGNFTVSLLFHDVEAVKRFYDELGRLLDDIRVEPFAPSWDSNSPPDEIAWQPAEPKRPS